MGLTDRMQQLAGNVQNGVKTTSMGILSLVLKIISSAVLGLFFAILGEALMNYGLASYLLVFLITGAIFFRLLKPWSMGKVVVFDLICVLVALLMRMYIMIAP